MSGKTPSNGMYSLTSNSLPLYPSVGALLADAAAKGRLGTRDIEHTNRDMIFVRLCEFLGDLFRDVPSDVRFCIDEDSERIVAFRPSRSELSVAYVDVRHFRDSILEEQQPAPSAPAPPHGAQLLLLLISTKNREHLLGDMEEEYTTIVLPEYGRSRAWFWYWWQAAISVASHLWAQLWRRMC